MCWGIILQALAFNLSYGFQKVIFRRSTYPLILPTMKNQRAFLCCFTSFISLTKNHLTLWSWKIFFTASPSTIIPACNYIVIFFCGVPRYRTVDYSTITSLSFLSIIYVITFAFPLTRFLDIFQMNSTKMKNTVLVIQ